MPNPNSAQVCQVRLLSAEMLHTPGLIAWAVNGYKFRRDRKALRRVIGETFGLTDRCVDDLLSGRVPFTVDGDVVVFEYAVGKAKRPE